MGTCVVCRKPAARGDRCWTCYQFRRRTGRDRTPEMILAANRQRLDEELERKVVAAIVGA